MFHSRLLPVWTGLILAVQLLGEVVPKPSVRPSDSEGARKLAPQVRADARVLVDANNRFAFDIYSRQRAKGGNLFLSPYSISTAFAMMSAGAAGQTQKEIANAFHFSLPPERFHPTFGALQKSLDRGTRLGGYELRVANRAWGQNGPAFRPEFLRITRQHYGAEIQPADFQRDHESARRSANAWVEERTNRRITDLFPPGSIGTDTRLVIANAIYFKGRWAETFRKDQTADRPFHISAREVASVPTMNRRGTYRIAETQDVQMLELPYQGGDLSMLVVLPRRNDGLAELESKLSPQRLEEWSIGLVEGDVMVSLPRFKFTAKLELRQVLTEMGMPSPFRDGVADFSGINGGRDFFISAAVHQAFVEVNEEGTEAAGATGISVGIVSMPPTFTADHPFLFLIRDNVTGSILFLGRVVDPRA